MPCERVVCQTMAFPDRHHPCLTSQLRMVKVTIRSVHSALSLFEKRVQLHSNHSLLVAVCRYGGRQMSDS